MDAPFTDSKRRPTADDVLAALGRAAPAWRALFAQLSEKHPGLQANWGYFSDGKRWLMKLTRKSKTACWVNVERGRFHVSFYFAERLMDALLASELSAASKLALKSSKPIGKLRQVKVSFGPQRGVRDVLTLVSLKERLK